jgi:WhiB family redox-sensing transcriptional regulator
MAERTNYTNAVCRDVDPELFFPVGTTMPAKLQTEDAKNVCRACPLVEECLQDHIYEQFGVFGATSPDERRKMLANPKFRRMVEMVG